MTTDELIEKFDSLLSENDADYKKTLRDMFEDNVNDINLPKEDDDYGYTPVDVRAIYMDDQRIFGEIIGSDLSNTDILYKNMVQYFVESDKVFLGFNTKNFSKRYFDHVEASLRPYYSELLSELTEEFVATLAFPKDSTSGQASV